MHHLRSGAQNLQPTGALGGLMTLITARNTFPRWEGCGRPGRVREGRMGARPQRPPHWVGKGLGGGGKRRGRDLGGGVEKPGWRGGRGGGALGGGREGLPVLSRVCGFSALISCQGNLEGQAGLQPSPGARSQWSGLGCTTHPHPEPTSFHPPPPKRNRLATQQTPHPRPPVLLQLFGVLIPSGQWISK